MGGQTSTALRFRSTVREDVHGRSRRWSGDLLVADHENCCCQGGNSPDRLNSIAIVTCVRPQYEGKPRGEVKEGMSRVIVSYPVMR